MSETLTVVEEEHRSNGEYFIREDCLTCDFLFARKDETYMVSFSEVSAYVERGHEWANFDPNDESACQFHLSNETADEPLPHWLFEEFSHIENHGTLRPVDDYEENYQLKDLRSMA